MDAEEPVLHRAPGAGRVAVLAHVAAVAVAIGVLFVAGPLVASRATARVNPTIEKDVQLSNSSELGVRGGGFGVGRHHKWWRGSGVRAGMVVALRWVVVAFRWVVVTLRWGRG